MDINNLWSDYDLNSKKQNSRCLAVNTILEGKYLVGPVLGQGGFGITYVGYDLVQPMGRGEQGGSTALPCYVHYAKEALKAYPPDDFAKPETGIVDVQLGENLVLPFYEGTDPFSGYGSNSAMGGEDGGMDDVGAALESLQGSAPGPDGEAVAVPPEVLVRQKQAAQRRKAEEQARQGEDLLMEMF